MALGVRLVRSSRIPAARTGALHGQGASAKKTGPLRARPQVRQRGGASESPSRGEETANQRLPIWEDHGQPQVRQQYGTMQSDSASHNMVAGMPAMRRQHRRPYKLCDNCNRLVWDRDRKKRDARCSEHDREVEP
jgi:hypothetical protein